MKKIYLRTTKLEIKNEEFNKETLNLGDWCLNLEERLNSNSSHHVKLVENKQEIFLYLIKLKEKILSSLIIFLNKFHKIEKDYEYWNFLIGPWLLQFLHVSYDRWTVFETNKELDTSKLFTLIVNLPLDHLIPDEMHISKRFYYQDLWNHFLFGEIIKFKKKISFEIVEPKEELNLNELVKNKNKKQSSLKKKIIDSLFYINEFFGSKKKIHTLIFPTNFHYKFQLKTFFKLKKFPIFLKSPPRYKVNVINKEVREKNITFDTQSHYEEFLQKNIAKFMPKSLIENYSEILSTNLIFYKNFKSKNFFISQFETQDQIKFYIAENKGSKKILYQHGGFYGLAKFAFREYIEVQSCDYYLTFGWKKDKALEYLDKKHQEKIVDFFPVHLFNQITLDKDNTLIYLILDEFPNYFYEYHSNYDSHNYKMYFKEIINFIKNLDSENRKNLVVRLYPEKFNKEIPHILKKLFPEISIDHANSDLLDEIKKAKLCVIGNNSTTFLQTFRLNIPTIIFWDEKIVRMRELSNEYFKKLNQSAIFHKSSKDAALFCNKNKKVYNWWSSFQNKKIVDEFVSEFASKDETKINKLISIIKNEK